MFFTVKTQSRIITIIIFLLCIVSASAEVPDYFGEPAIPINNNIPTFSDDELSTVAYVEYSELDKYGRVGPAIACIGPEFPIGARSVINQIQPSGWRNEKYGFIPGNYIYNRSHLIAHRFSGSGEVNENLFTGTHYLNQTTMAQVETAVANYVDQTGHHVMYRVTPDFRENELVCRGIEIEAQSVEDSGVAFHVYLYNIEPGASIDYRTGANHLAEYKAEIETRDLPKIPEEAQEPEEAITTYVLNTNSKRFHRPECNSVVTMKKKNRKDFTGTREELIQQGYKPCGECKP